MLFEADKYIKENNQLVISKSNDRKQVVEQVESAYKELLLFAEQILEKMIAEQKTKKVEYESLKNETAEYFKLRKSVLKIAEGEAAEEKLADLKYVNSRIVDIRSRCLSDSEKTLSRQEYMNILTFLGYRFEDEEECVTTERIKSYLMEEADISNYSYHVFTQKVNAIKSILDNKEYLELNDKLKNALEKNNQIEREREILKELKFKAEERSEKISRLVIQLEKEEYAAVGPNLKKYYKKLARIDAIEAIDIVLEDHLISMIDEKKKNIVNILSNGQLSVFMLSYFFAGITTRSKTEKCKIYFIDDLTACMDDVNMLAFLDLLKYQMLSKEKNMEQIFFVTCDSKICRLLRYKLEGCNIEYCELGEKNFI